MGLLRLLLAISVVLAHSNSIFGFKLVGGEMAVQAFYIISGFYMSLILNEKYIGLNNSFRLFISNRFLRLFPIYWIMLLSTLLLSLFLGIYSHGDKWANLSSYIAYGKDLNWITCIYFAFTNVFLFLQDTVTFLGLNLSTGHLYFTAHYLQTNPMVFSFMIIPQAWTVGIEITFYLVAPFLVRKDVKLIIVIIAFSLLLRLLLIVNGLTESPWSNRFFPTEIVLFLLGNLSYRLYKKLTDIELKQYFMKIVFCSLILITLLYNFIPMNSKYVLYLVMFFLAIPFIFILTKKNKFDKYIGELSYPIYISHIFVFTFISGVKLPMIGGKGFTLSIASIVFAILLNELVAKRIEKIRQRRIIKS